MLPPVRRGQSRAVLTPRTRALLYGPSTATVAAGEPRRLFHAPPGARLHSSRGATSARPNLGVQSAGGAAVPVLVTEPGSSGGGIPLDIPNMTPCTRMRQYRRSRIHRSLPDHWGSVVVIGSRSCAPPPAAGGGFRQTKGRGIHRPSARPAPVQGSEALRPVRARSLCAQGADHTNGLGNPSRDNRTPLRTADRAKGLSEAKGCSAQ